MPIADVAALFDHSIGTRRQAGWDVNSDLSCGFQIDDELKLGRLQHGQVGRNCAFKDTNDKVADLPICLRQARTVARQATRFRKFSPFVDREQPQLCSGTHD